MKKIIATAVIIFFFFSPTLYAQLPALQQKAIIVKRMIELKHYSPRPVDDSFSVTLFKLVINTADRRRIYFTANEYKQLLAFNTILDDELQGKGWAFFDLFSSLYKNALMRTDTIISKLTQKAPDFSTNDSIGAFKENEFVFPADNAAMPNRWARRLRYLEMDYIYDMVRADSAHKTSFKDALVSKEPAAREKIKQNEKKAIAKKLNAPGGYDACVAELYLNAIANCFDPHSNYFSAKDNEEFQSELSTQGLSFGIDMDENDKGQVVIERLAPGGPAWKTGELNKGDEIISLQWEGKEGVNIEGGTLETADEVLDESNHDRLVFKVRKADGAIITVLLRKEKIERDENIVKGFVLKGEKKVGYILLPGFYTEWENESGSSCANDVAKEIIKLKKENIEGLILDLRYNGGGSLGEALEMAGIFIDEGPLLAEKDRDKKQVTLKDPNRGTIYDGPLALMVNGQSASASEILAACLQDYNRAVIIGSNTYGKATGQQVFSLDTMSNKAEPAPGKDAVKITVGKLYRLTGGTAQFSGVLPEVLLPDAFDAMEYREKFSKNALQPDTAKRNNYYKPLPLLPVNELSRKSMERVNTNAGFNEIRQLVEKGKKIINESYRPLPLKSDAFEKWHKENIPDFELLKEQGVPGKKFTVENHARDIEILRISPYVKEVNDVWLKNIARDIYIEEAFSVLLDLINLQKPANQN